MLGVMFLCGIWHGAGWCYILWGTFHGVALIIERFGRSKIQMPNNKIVNVIRMIVVFFLVSFLWIFFKLPDFSHVVKYIEAITLNTFSMSDHAIIICVNIILYSIPILAYHAFYLMEEKPIFIKMKKCESIAYGILLFAIITNSGFSDSFIYFIF